MGKIRRGRGEVALAAVGFAAVGVRLGIVAVASDRVRITGDRLVQFSIAEVGGGAGRAAPGCLIRVEPNRFRALEDGLVKIPSSEMAAAKSSCPRRALPRLWYAQAR